MVEPTARFGVAIRNTVIPAQDTGIRRTTSVEAVGLGKSCPASVLPDARLIAGQVVLYADLYREPETARWIARVRRIRGRS